MALNTAKFLTKAAAIYTPILRNISIVYSNR